MTQKTVVAPSQPSPVEEARGAYRFVVSPRCLDDGSWRGVIETFAESFSSGQSVELALMRPATESAEAMLGRVLEAVRSTGRRTDHIASISTYVAPDDEAGWTAFFSQSAAFVPSSHPEDARLVRLARARGVEIALSMSAHNFHLLLAKGAPDRVYTTDAGNPLNDGRVMRLGEHTKSSADLAAASDFPADIQLEMSSKCNARCVMCPVSEGTPNQNMDYALFERVVAQCEGQDGLERFWFHLYGESLLHPRILDAWRHARERLPNVALGTYSNGSLMTEEKAKLALETLDTLVFSIDGATRETFEGIRKGLKFDEVRGNVLRVIELRDELNSKTTICVNMTETDENRHEREAFVDYWSERGVFANVYPEMSKVVGRGIEPVRSVTPCYSPFVNMVIFSDGTVVPCCDDSRKLTPIGDVRVQTIAEIWKGPAIGAYREKHLLGRKCDLAACENCDNNRWRLLEGFF